MSKTFLRKATTPNKESFKKSDHLSAAEAKRSHISNNSIQLASAKSELNLEGGEVDGLISDAGASFNLAKAKTYLGTLFEDDDKQIKGFEDGRKSRIEFQKLQITDIATGIVSMIGVGLNVMAYDLEFEERDEKRLDFLLQILLFTTCIAIILNFLMHIQKLRYLKAKNIIEEKENLISSGQIYWFLAEIFVFILQPYPFLQGIKVHMYNDYLGIEYYHYVNDFLSLLMVFRAYIILRFLLNTTMYRSPSAQRLTEMYGAENNYLYAVKCLMKTSPFKTCMALLVGSLFIFGYQVRICERPLNRYADVSMDFGSYWNSMWTVILTMTTVGYGDFFPRTHLGRFVVFVNCIWGVAVVSLMVVTLNNILAMSNSEEKALTVLQRLELRKKLKSEAAYVLTNMAKIGLNNRKETNEEIKKAKNKRYIQRIKSHLSAFKATDRQIRSLSDTGNISEEMTRQFEFLRDELKQITAQQAHIEKSVNTLCDMFGVKGAKRDFPSRHYEHKAEER